MTGVRFCPACGAPRSAGAAFCGACGFDIAAAERASGSPTPPVRAASVEPASRVEPPAHQPRSLRTGGIALGLLLVVAVVGIGTFVLVRGFGQQPSPSALGVTPQAPAVAAAGATATPVTATAAPAASGPPETPAPTPVAMTPTAPPGGDALLIRVDSIPELGVGWIGIEYLVDGTVIRADWDDISPGPVTRRLSAVGLAHVNEALAPYADLLQDDAEYAPTLVDPDRPAPGVDRPLRDFYAPLPSTVHPRVHVRVESWYSSDVSYFNPDSRIERLSTLASILFDPERLAGADGWSSPGWVPFEPAHHVLFVVSRQTDDPSSEFTLGDIAWPMLEGPYEFGSAFSGYPLDSEAYGTARCAIIDTTVLTAFTDALGDGGFVPFWPVRSFPTVGDPVAGRDISIQIWDLLPDKDEMTCLDPERSPFR